MNFEYKNTVSSSENRSEVLDDKWYDRFKEVGAFQDYEYLTGDKELREEQKDKFFKGEIENPALDYPELEKFDFAQKEQKLLELKKDILDNEKNEVVRQLYRWKINEKLAQLRMLKNSKEGNDRKFVRYSKFIYGAPDEEVFRYGLSRIADLVNEKRDSEYLDIRLAAQRIYEQFFLEKKAENFETSVNSFEKKLFDYSLPNDKKYDAEQIKAFFEGALDIFRINGFKVVVDEKGNTKSINVSQEKNTINIPKERKVKENSLRSLMVHEINTHTKRRLEGEKSKLRLLGLGLDRYLKGEEGIATYSEQQLEEADDYAEFGGHFAISLAMGLDGKKRNFRDVFEILKDYYFIKSKKERTKALESSQKNAWNQCLRTFRGTTCKTQGACLTRDIVYREGNIGVWNVIKNNPEEERRFSIGKYDPSNSRHIWILDQLGITDKDLEELEK